MAVLDGAMACPPEDSNGMADGSGAYGYQVGDALCELMLTQQSSEKQG